MTQAANMLRNSVSAARARGSEAHAEPLILEKRIGSTVYTVKAHFSNTGSETLSDKILRLARNDGLDFQSRQPRRPLRTGRSERKAV